MCESKVFCASGWTLLSNCDKAKLCCMHSVKTIIRNSNPIAILLTLALGER